MYIGVSVEPAAAVSGGGAGGGGEVFEDHSARSCRVLREGAAPLLPFPSLSAPLLLL